MFDLDMYEGENYYWFGIGSVGFIGLGNTCGFIFADTITQAKDRIREHNPIGVLSIRKAILSEWDCNSFSNSGHIQHR